MNTAGRALVAVVVTAVAAGLVVVDPGGAVSDALALAEALVDTYLSGGPASDPETVEELADSAARREAHLATLRAILARDPILSASLAAVGTGVGLLAGGSVAYRRQRAAIRRGEEDV